MTKSKVNEGLQRERDVGWSLHESIFVGSERWKTLLTAVLEDIRFMSGWNMYDTGARAAIEVDRGYVESRNKNGARLRA